MLQLQIIEKIFAELKTIYGREFMARYDGINEMEVKSSWSYELAGFANDLLSISWALEHLPERAPNVIEFRQACRHAPARLMPGYKFPEYVPPVINISEGLPKYIEYTPLNDSKNWARAIIARFNAGETLYSATLQHARDALGIKKSANWT